MSERSTALSRPSVHEREIRDDSSAPLPSADMAAGTTSTCRESRVNVISRQQLQSCLHWQRAFAAQHKDRRYYEIVEDTIHPEFDYWYFAIRDQQGEIQAIQPFFILDQDILAGVHPHFSRLMHAIRLQWPRFMFMKTMMVGCAAGEAHLDGRDEPAGVAIAQSLAGAIVEHARSLGARLIVLKEFPDDYRGILSCFVRGGFTRIPSMPQTRLNICYASFDDYMQSALNSATRRKLRKKFKATQSAQIELSVIYDITSVINEVYPLYLQVYERSKLHFERLTKDYFCRLGTAMPDKVRFFVWRCDAKVVAFGVCMVHGDTLFAEYLGLDYNVALELHLYHYVFRDLVRWAIANGYKWFQSTGLNYDPKLHLRHWLKPVDLYVRHTSAFINMLMRIALPLLEPTRHDVTLKKFPNYADLWGSQSCATTPGDGAALSNSMTTSDVRKGWGATSNRRSKHHDA
jgi:Peptidogalycan biosysnthesis/recognition